MAQALDAAHAQLVSDIAEVVLDRVGPHIQVVGHVATAHAVPDQVEDLPLGGGEDVGMRRPAT
jgi:hypothetical protein